MKKQLSIFLLGALLGAGTLQVAHVVHSRKTSQVFERRVKCKGLADDYQKSNSDEYASVFLIRVDFSTARNSCVAAVEEVNTAVSRQNRYDYFKVVDLISAQVLFHQVCRAGKDAEGQPDYCGNGKDGTLAKARDEFLERELRASSW